MDVRGSCDRKVDRTPARLAAPVAHSGCEPTDNFAAGLVRHGEAIAVVDESAVLVCGAPPAVPRYPVFLTFSILGSIAWGVGLPFVGYFLGNIPFVGRHIELIVVVIAVLSTVPVIASAAGAFIRRRRAGGADVSEPTATASTPGH